MNEIYYIKPYKSIRGFSRHSVVEYSYQRDRNIGLLSSRASLTSWEEGAFLALLGHPLVMVSEKTKTKNFNGSFLWIGFNCLKVTEPLRRDSLLVTTKSQGVFDTHFIDLRRVKSLVGLGANQWF